MKLVEMQQIVTFFNCPCTAQSWWCTDPSTGEYDDGAWWDARLAALYRDDIKMFERHVARSLPRS